MASYGISREAFNGVAGRRAGRHMVSNDILSSVSKSHKYSSPGRYITEKELYRTGSRELALAGVGAAAYGGYKAYQNREKLAAVGHDLADKFNSTRHTLGAH